MFSQLSLLAGKDQENTGYLGQIEYVSFRCSRTPVQAVEGGDGKRCLSLLFMFAKYTFYLRNSSHFRQFDRVRKCENLN